MKVLITGAAGFIGHHVLEHLLDKHPHWSFTILDRLDTSGNLNRLAEIGLPKWNVRTVFYDLRAAFNDQVTAQIGHQDYILHLAAGTHVDRSIEDPMDFVQNNVVATCNILNFARRVGCEKFLNFSTDEVFGPAPVGTAYREDDRYRSGNPYAATKAGAEELGVAFHNTYGVPVITTHTMNVIGERQHPEKFLPMTVAKILRGEKVIIHANKELTRAGSRFYIHARDVARAIDMLLEAGIPGEKYNIVGAEETDNLQLATMVGAAIGRDFQYKFVDFHSSRPGHDLRYALDGRKLSSMGWEPSLRIQAAIEQTARWYRDHPNWLVHKLGEAA